MRKLLVVLVVVAVLPVVAWALSLNVSFRLPPLLNKIRPAAVVDENGNVLFGSVPAKVEVTNLLGQQEQVVTLFDSVTIPAYPGSGPSSSVFASIPVPPGMRSVTLLGDGRPNAATLLCWFALAPLAAPDDPVPKILAVNGAVLTIGVQGSPGYGSVGAVQGSSFACSVFHNDSVPQVVSLKARFTS